MWATSYDKNTSKLWFDPFLIIMGELGTTVFTKNDQLKGYSRGTITLLTPCWSYKVWTKFYPRIDTINIRYFGWF